MGRFVKFRTLSASIIVALALAISFFGVATTQAAPSHVKGLASSHIKGSGSVCIVHDVYLNGSQPATLTCAKYSNGAIVSSTGVVALHVSGVSPDGVSPDITEGACDGNLLYWINSYYTGSWCFYGYGYIGLGSAPSGDLYTINLIDTNDEGYACGSGWVRYYTNYPTYNNGRTFNVGACAVYDSGNSVFNSTCW